MAGNEKNSCDVDEDRQARAFEKASQVWNQSLGQLKDPTKALLSLAQVGFALAEIAMANTLRLERRLQEIESKGVSYRGMYNPSEDYRRGDLISYKGSMFCCTRDTQGTAPFSNEPMGVPRAADHPWQLAIQRGRKGKDAR
jgi:hypothetical protein